MADGTYMPALVEETVATAKQVKSEVKNVSHIILHYTT
jgi:hypothetical protein